MKQIINILFINILLIYNISAQSLSFTLDQSIKVNNEQGQLANAWLGGLNSAQISTIDLNGDKVEDVVIFDRTSYKISTFLNQNGVLRYAPDYEAAFPAMEYWCLLIDYDKDGRKDIFTATRLGVRVFRNTTTQGNFPTFTLFKNGLSVKSTTGNIFGLLPELGDIPAIADMDGDGDLDIINFLPFTGQTIEFSKNFSMERYNKLDSLEFEKTTLQWANITECSSCNEYFFGNSSCRTEKTEHSGHAMVALDLNSDGIKDFLLSDINCTGVTAFINKGTAANAVFDSFTPNFPPSNPVNMTSFPASFIEDVDNDGLKDLIVSPNQFFNDGNKIDFTNSIWFYKNTGTNGTPNFIFQKKNFLQDQTIDLGESAKPAFADYDADGDLDLFVSNGGQAIDNQAFKAKIFLFENIGSQENPAFRLINSDYASFSTLNLRYLKISFADLDNDGITDLAFAATNNTDGRSSVRYIRNTAAKNERFSFNISNLSSISLPNITPFDEPLFLDIDGDKDQDLLIARFQGGLQYFENTGNLTFALKNEKVGSIQDDFNKRALSIAVADFNQNNKPDLIAGNRSGSLSIYLDFTDKLTDSLITTNTNLIFNELLNKNVAYSFGAETFPAAYGDDIVVGLAGGGLQFLKNRNIITAIEEPKIFSQSIDFQVFPNPSEEKISIKTGTAGKISISNILGVEVIAHQKVIPQNEYEISLRNLANGIYLVNFVSEDGQKVVKKVVLNR
jgi:hypothetical protein